MAQREADLERFERVVLPHLDDAYTLARYLLRDEHDAQDVVQDAVLRAPRETDTLAIERSDRAMLERAVASLPTEFREVIVLREVEGLSYKEISDVIGVPIGTVMSRLARARKRLASALGLDVGEAS